MDKIVMDTMIYAICMHNGDGQNGTDKIKILQTKWCRLNFI